MKNGVFIVADDLGLHPVVNEGIVFALDNNYVQGVSLMPNAEATKDGVLRLKQINNPLVGIHFVLVEENPLTLKSFPKNHKSFFIKYIFGIIKIKDIEKEFRAQLNLCKSEGIKISFINSHQHLHLLPGILNIVIKLAKENNISYIRTVIEPFRFKAGLIRGLESIFLHWLSTMAKNKIKKNGLITNDLFIGFLNAGNLSKNDLEEARNYSKKYKGIIEVGSHPGLETKELREKYNKWGNYNWQKELELLRLYK